MTRDEAVTIVGMIVHGWPGPAWEVERMEAYVGSLTTFDAALTTAAVLRAQKTLRYRPSIAELREFIFIEQRLADPEEEPELPQSQRGTQPQWVQRWTRARANNDWRHFPEQCEYAGSSELFSESAVWVQPDEYLEGVASAVDAIVDLPDVGEERSAGLRGPGGDQAGAGA